MLTQPACLIAPLAILSFGFLGGVPPALADTYQLPIQNGGAITKIYVDNGEVHLVNLLGRIGSEDRIYVYEVIMEDGVCSSEVRLRLTNTSRLDVPYDVCTEAGFGLKNALY